MVSIFVLALLAAFIFLKADEISSRPDKNTYLIVSVAILIIITLYEVLFMHPTGAEESFTLNVVFLVSIATLISLGGIYLTAEVFKRPSKKGNLLILIVIICLLLTSSLSFLSMYGFNPTNWSGVDEVAYNYYAAYLFDHGSNPYVSSMEPILNQRHIFPTLQLDGNYEYAYEYPAFSFLVFFFMPLLNITSFYTFIVLVTVFSVFISYFLYYKSGFNASLLLPLGVWLFFSFILVGTTTHYLAIAVFVLLAYLERKNALLSGVLLGLAASTIQLAWFFIPFFYVLELREFGKKPFYNQVVSSILIFVLVNAYFVALSPHQTISNIFGLLGLNKLPPYGTNFMQFSYAFYPLSYWYSTFMSITVFMTLLILFYFYTKTLLPFIAVVPAMIFFLSWRNISIYDLPAIPLIFAVYYCSSNSKDLIEKKSYIVYAFAALVLIGVVVAIYSHAAYVENQGIRINSIIPILYISNATGGNMYRLGGFVANVSNNEPVAENVSFYMTSRSPNNEAYTPGSMLPVLAPGSSRNYTINFQLGLVNNSTRLFVMVFTRDYITSTTLNITIRAPPKATQPLK
ncbi:MAG: hypothetical protein ABSD68_00360 [Candidatus Micrarchaeales archaeon]|jgi:uncharacterized membrane protein